MIETGAASVPANGTLSILMPSYNAGGFLAAAVDSAVSQFGADDELIIQDGGSTDESVVALSRQYAADPRVKIVSEPDAGQSDALQRALARAVNPHLGWLNADDTYYPGALDAVRSVLAEQPNVDVVYGSSTIFAADGQVIRRFVPSQFSMAGFTRHGCHVFSGATFLRTELVREVGGFNHDLHYCMDFDLFFRVARQAQHSRQVDATLGGLRWHDASKSGGGQTLKFFREAMRIRLRYAETAADRRHIYRQESLRLAAVPLLPIRRSRAMARLNSVKTFSA